MLLDRMVESIAAGSLKTDQIQRDLFTGEVDPGFTYLDYAVLKEWLAGFGYQPGDWMSEFEHDEAGVQERLAEALYDIRNIRSRPSEIAADLLSARERALSDIDLDQFPDLTERTATDLREIVKGYAAEAAHLRAELKASAPIADALHLRPKSRNTLLRLVASLCFGSGINPNERGAASAIAILTEKCGLPIGDDTIRKIIADLPAFEQKPK